MMSETRSPRYEELKKKYEKNFVRKDQLAQYVKFSKITAEEYKLITGEDLPQ